MSQEPIEVGDEEELRAIQAAQHGSAERLHDALTLFTEKMEKVATLSTTQPFPKDGVDEHLTLLFDLVNALVSRKDVDENQGAEVLTFLKRVVTHVISLSTPHHPILVVKILFRLLVGGRYSWYFEPSYRADIAVIDEIAEVLDVSAFQKGRSSARLLTVTFHFHSCSGWDVLVEFLKLRDDEGRNVLPQVEYCQIIHLLKSATHPFLIEPAVVVGNIITQPALDYLTNMTDEEVKSFPVKDLEMVFKRLHDYWTELDLQDGPPNPIIDRFRLNFSVRLLLKIPFITWKLDGLTYINSVCRSLTNQSDRMELDVEHKPPISADEFVEFIENNEVVQFLVGEHTHLELLSRLEYILIFLAQENRMGENVLEMLWNGTQGKKHESLIHKVWELISSLSVHLSPEQISYIYKLLIKLPKSEYDYQFVQCLNQLTQRGIVKMIAADITPRLWFALDLFWDIVQDGSGYPAAVISAAAEAFSYLLVWKPCKMVRTLYMEKCIKNVTEVQSVPQSLKFMKDLIFQYSHEESTSTLVEWMQNVHNFLDLFLEVLGKYVAHVIAHLNDVPKDVAVEDHHFKGSMYALTPFLTMSYDFLAVLLSSTELELTPPQVDAFWDVAITNAVSSQIQDIGFRWFENTLGGRKQFSVFSNELVEYILDSKLSTMNFTSVSTVGFSLFEFFFRYTNWHLKAFLQQGDQYEVLSFNLTGMEGLWGIALSAANEEVGTRAIELILRLEKSLSPALAPEVDDHRKEFCARSMQRLQEAAKLLQSPTSTPTQKVEAERRFSRCIVVLRKVITTFDAGLSRHGNNGIGSPLEVEIRETGGNKTTVVYSTHDKSTVGELRQFAIKNLKASGPIRMIFSGKLLDKDPEQLSEVGMTSVSCTVHVIQSTKLTVADTLPKGISPSEILSSSTYLEQLFSLLDLPDKLALDVWSILELLPTDETVSRGLSSIPDGTDFSVLLDSSNVFKLYYSLQIVDEFLQQDQSSADLTAPWKTAFISKGGLSHLFHIISSLDFRKTSLGAKRLPCLSLLLKIVHVLLPGSQLDLSSFDGKKMSLTLMDVCLIPSPSPATEDPVQTVLRPQQNYVIARALTLLSVLMVTSPNGLELVQSVVESPNAESWLSHILLGCPFSLTRASSVASLKRIVEVHTTSASAFLTITLKLLPIAIDSSNVTSAAEYFSLLLWLFETDCVSAGSSADPSKFKNVLEVTVNTILDHPIVEVGPESPPDQAIIGLLSLTRLILNVFPNFRPKVATALFDHLFYNCLFNIPTVEHHPSPPPPLCKTEDSRVVAFQLLLDFAKHDQAALALLSGRLVEEQRRQAFKNNWEYVPEGYDRNERVSYVGLKNMGATCYMNSLLQQFFMLPQFRVGLFGATPQVEEESSLEGNVLHQVQSLFTTLQESKKRFTDTRAFSKTYTFDGQPLNPAVQMDADEFFRGLLDKLETDLKGGPNEKLVDRFFSGNFVYQVISKECEHISEREEKFLNLTLEVVNKTHLNESLDLLVQGDLLDGDNKYKCEKCDKKVNAVRRCTIGDLPNVLVLHLKRFHFDLATFNRMKLNSYLEFEETLNLEPYTKDGLTRRDVAAANNGEMPPPVHPLDYYEYKLKGIVVHTGSIDSGHYYSFIRDLDHPDKWFEFNDRHVSPWDPAHMREAAFGGEDHTHRRLRPYNAFLLFYERVNPPTPAVDVPVPLAEMSSRIPDVLNRRIWSLNETFLRDKMFFSQSFLRFTHDQIKLAQEVATAQLEPSDPTPVLNTLESATQFLIQTYMHSKDQKHLKDFYGTLQEMYLQNPVASRNFLKTITSDDNAWIQTTLIQCPSEVNRGLFLKLVISCISVVIPEEVEKVFQYEEVDKMETDEALKTGEEDSSSAKVKSPYKQPSGQALSLCIRVLDRFLLLSKDQLRLSRYRHFYAEFFKFFESILSVHPIFSKVYQSRNILLHLINLARVPWVENKKHKSLHQEKIDSIALANSKHIHGAVAAYVMCMNIPRGDLRAKATSSEVDAKALPTVPTLLFDEGTDLVDPTGLQFAFSELPLMIKKKVNVTQLMDAVIHLSFGNKENSKLLIKKFIGRLDADNVDALSGTTRCLQALMHLGDSLDIWRIEMMVPEVLVVLKSNIRYKLATRTVLRFMAVAVTIHERFGELLFESVNEIVTLYLLHPEHVVRSMAEVLLQEFFPERKGYLFEENAKADVSSTAKSEEPFEATLPLTSISRKRLESIFELVLPLLDDNELWNTNPYGGSHVSKASDYPAFNILRFAKWLLIEPSDHKRIVPYVERLSTMFQIVNRKEKPTDYHKLALLRLFVQCSESVEFLRAFVPVESPEKHLNIVMSCWINPDKPYLSYLCQLLPLLYRFLTDIMKAYTEPIPTIALHSNLAWCISPICIFGNFHCSDLVLDLFSVLIPLAPVSCVELWMSTVAGITSRLNYVNEEAKTRLAKFIRLLLPPSRPELLPLYFSTGGPSTFARTDFYQDIEGLGYVEEFWSCWAHVMLLCARWLTSESLTESDTSIKSAFFEDATMSNILAAGESVIVFLLLSSRSPSTFTNVLSIFSTFASVKSDATHKTVLNTVQLLLEKVINIGTLAVSEETEVNQLSLSKFVLSLVSTEVVKGVTDSNCDFLGIALCYSVGTRSPSSYLPIIEAITPVLPQLIERNGKSLAHVVIRLLVNPAYPLSHEAVRSFTDLLKKSVAIEDLSMLEMSLVTSLSNLEHQDDSVVVPELHRILLVLSEIPAFPQQFAVSHAEEFAILSRKVSALMEVENTSVSEVQALYASLYPNRTDE